MRAMLVVMRDVRGEDVLEVAAAEDQQPVETFTADAADPALGARSRLRRPHGRFDPPMPSARKTSSKSQVNLMKVGVLGEQTLLVVMKPFSRGGWSDVVRRIGSEPQTP
jgi:hypothetical protein